MGPVSGYKACSHGASAIDIMKRTLNAENIFPKCPRLTALSVSTEPTINTAWLGRSAAARDLSLIRADLEYRRRCLEIREACEEHVSHEEWAHLQIGELQLTEQVEAARARALSQEKLEACRLRGPISWQDYLLEDL